ncbi:hypothetical protein BGW36DRAFT_390274 [Talaromyces proteolyticus]|uniref:CENP-V/GFA domain-containing protein n=1 Tax=Talaromyces proteolyticus TaxID=1131652 RepID=A0AAD4KGY7_9EURO|nr:uncharacterized protein BGW36DRAFT_390274 [Talaromyces proteolyticus]KAH8690142.1 hypothetical protein BGW36DRAFT_390274 [Talaromyces proteolyticus]
MAFVPKEATVLEGGCFCKAIRYTISIPAIADRPLVPRALPTSVGFDKGQADSPRTVPTNFPLVGLDHCQSCRQSSGAIIQCWFVCPAEWVRWSFLPRDDGKSAPLGPGERSVVAPEVASENLLPSMEASETAEESSRIDLSTLDAVTPRTPKKGATDPVSDVPRTRDTYLTHWNSSPETYRSFCGRCGTTLTFFYDRPVSSPMPPLVDITVGSLDNASLERIRPDRHLWWDDGTSWIQQLVRHGDGGFLLRHPTGAVSSTIEL